MKKYTISDECIKMTETKKPVEVTELINYHFPFTEKIKFVLHQAASLFLEDTD